MFVLEIQIVPEFRWKSNFYDFFKPISLHVGKNFNLQSNNFYLQNLKFHWSKINPVFQILLLVSNLTSGLGTPNPKFWSFFSI